MPLMTRNPILTEFIIWIRTNYPEHLDCFKEGHKPRDSIKALAQKIKFREPKDKERVDGYLNELRLYLRSNK